MWWGAFLGLKGSPYFDDKLMSALATQFSLEFLLTGKLSPELFHSGKQGCIVITNMRMRGKGQREGGRIL